MNKFSLLGMVILVAGCASVYTNTNEVEDGIFEITAHGNSSLDLPEMNEAAFKKAKQACGHENYSQLGETSYGNTRVYLTTIGGYTNTKKLVIKIDCNADQ